MTPTPTALTETIDTPDGAFTIVSDRDGHVLAAGWTADPRLLIPRIHRQQRPTEVGAGSTAAAAAVIAYYDGDPSAVSDYPVLQPGTELQQRGWEMLRALPPGTAISYQEFAARLGKPAASRAAAGICARNAAALFVPCHRVRRGDGQLGGFAWGTGVKQSLLQREAVLGWSGDM